LFWRQGVRPAPCACPIAHAPRAARSMSKGHISGRPLALLHFMTIWLRGKPTSVRVGRQLALSLPILVLALLYLKKRVLRCWLQDWRCRRWWHAEARSPRSPLSPGSRLGDLERRPKVVDPFQRLEGGREMFELMYRIIGRITDSTYGSVFDCACRSGMFGGPCAVKIVRKIDHPLLSAAAMQQPSGFGKARIKAQALAQVGKQRQEPEEFWRYMWKLLSLRHDNVVQYLEFFADTTSLYFVMEKCLGCTLLDHVMAVEVWRESAARPLVRQLLEALQYIHGLRLIHRDVKLENLMILTESPTAQRGSRVLLKILDFGLGCEAPGNGAIGTLGYMAPEVFGEASYDTGVDVFSAGVVLHILLTGRPAFQPPMNARFLDEHREALHRGPDRRQDPFPRISSSGQNLVGWMLHASACARCSAEEALRHRWLVGETVAEGNVGRCRGAKPRSEEDQLWKSQNSELSFLRVMGVWRGSSTACALSSMVASQNLLCIEEAEGDEEEGLLDELCFGLVRHMELPVCIADPAKEDCPVAVVSWGFEELTGYRQQDIAGKNCRLLNLPRRAELSKETLSALHEAESGGSTFLGAVPNARKDGSHFENLLHLSPLELRGRKLVIGVQMEVTSRSVDLDGHEIWGATRKVHSAIRHWTRGHHKNAGWAASAHSDSGE